MIEQKIKELRKKIQNYQMEKVRLEESLKNKQARLIELQEKCKEKGFNPDDLINEITKRQTTISELTTKIENILAGKLDQKPKEVEASIIEPEKGSKPATQGKRAKTIVIDDDNDDLFE